MEVFSIKETNEIGKISLHIHTFFRINIVLKNANRVAENVIYLVIGFFMVVKNKIVIVNNYYEVKVKVNLF